MWMIDGDNISCVHNGREVLDVVLLLHYCKCGWLMFCVGGGARKASGVLYKYGKDTNFLLVWYFV